jgi:hypothetical protein
VACDHGPLPGMSTLVELSPVSGKIAMTGANYPSSVLKLCQIQHLGTAKKAAALHKRCRSSKQEDDFTTTAHKAGCRLLSSLLYAIAL